jgi:quinol monooxygenase YgiN
MAERITFGVVARLRGIRGKADELRERLTELTGLVRSERGCLSCELVEDGSDPTEFTLLQEWENEGAHVAHFSARCVQDAMRFLPDLLSGDFDPHKYVLQSNTVKYGTNCYPASGGWPSSGHARRRRTYPAPHGTLMHERTLV